MRPSFDRTVLRSFRVHDGTRCALIAYGLFLYLLLSVPLSHLPLPVPTISISPRILERPTQPSRGFSVGFAGDFGS